jgi:hypothetical protein
MQRFLSFSDSPAKEKVEIPEKYRAYLEECWDKSRKNQMRAWQELGGKQIVY